MLTAELFDLEELYFLEPSYERLLDHTYTDQLLTLGAKEWRILVDEEEIPMGVAVHTDRWYGIALVHREPTDALIKEVEDIEVDVYQASYDDFVKALREYYSILLEENNKPALEDLSVPRKANVQDLFKQCFGKGKLKGRTCLDVGCGSGMGSDVIHALGMHAVSYDLDVSLLSSGLKSGRLYHHETMNIDASWASRYIDPVDFGALLMAGRITEFNSVMWKTIVTETLALSNTTLITVETEDEAKMVKKWIEGRKVEVFENPRDAFYDRWALLVKLGDHRR